MGIENNEVGGKLMRIGELACRAGTTMRTIRYYEERGLIAPVARTKGGFRLYEEEELRKLHLIRSLQALDISLAQVKAFFDERSHGRIAADIAPGLQRVLRAQLDEMGRRLEQYRVMQESIRETIEILDSCSRCALEPGPGVCSQCPVIVTRETVPPHMQAVIDQKHRTVEDPRIVRLSARKSRRALRMAMV